jgi:hypothetical protein
VRARVNPPKVNFCQLFLENIGVFLLSNLSPLGVFSLKKQRKLTPKCDNFVSESVELMAVGR